MTKKSALIILVAILIVSTSLLKFGSYITHQNSKQNNFIGQVGNTTYVDNSSNKEISQRDLNYLWGSFLRGAPAPFQLFKTLLTKRIEIIDANFNRDDRCGLFHINTYTYFNIKRIGNLIVKEPCP